MQNASCHYFLVFELNLVIFLNISLISVDFKLSFFFFFYTKRNWLEIQIFFSFVHVFLSIFAQNLTNLVW